MIFDYINNDAVITEFKRLVTKSRFNKPSLKAFIDEGMRKILPEKGNKDFRIAFVPIVDYEAQMPKSFSSLTQSPLYTKSKEAMQDLNSCESIKENEVDFEECDCTPVDDCSDKSEWRLKDFRCDNDCILDILLHRNFVSYQNFEPVRESWFDDLEDKVFYLTRPRINNFSNLKYHLGSCQRYLAPNLVIEYQMESPQLMSINVKDGYLLLSYLAHKQDKDGYFLVPDDPFVIDALVHYLISKETLGHMMENKADGHNKGLWRNMVSLVPRKMLAAKAQLKNEDLDRVNILLETSWSTHVYNRDALGGYKPPLNFYPRI